MLELAARWVDPPIFGPAGRSSGRRWGGRGGELGCFSAPSGQIYGCVVRRGTCHAAALGKVRGVNFGAPSASLEVGGAGWT